MSQKLGLIAGNGKFPLLFSEEAKRQGKNIFAVCINQDTMRQISRLVHKTFWINVWEFQKMVDFFKQEQITEVAMAGQISPYLLFKARSKFDAGLRNLLGSIGNKKADTIFGAIADKLAAEGIRLIDSTSFLKNFMPAKDVLTKRLPSETEVKDIQLGFETAKHLGAIDIGQTVVIKDGAVLAVEAFEGTDSTILRGGLLGGKGVVVVKTSKPNQDMRFDVPLVGLRTIKNLIRIRANCLAFEAEKTLLLDREKCTELADKNNISIVAA